LPARLGGLARGLLAAVAREPAIVPPVATTTRGLAARANASTLLSGGAKATTKHSGHTASSLDSGRKASMAPEAVDALPSYVVTDSVKRHAEIS
jgi:hypothetical protein